MTWQQRLLWGWRLGVVAAVLMGGFWLVWYLCAGGLPSIGDVVLKDAPWGPNAIDMPGLLAFSHVWDPLGLLAAVVLTTVAILTLAFWIDVPETQVCVLGSGCVGGGTLLGIVMSIAGSVAAGQRDLNFAAVTMLATMGTAMPFVTGFFIAMVFNRHYWKVAATLIAYVAMVGLLTGIGAALTGLGAVWMPLIGLAVGLAAALAVGLGSAALALGLLLLAETLVLIASPRTGLNRFRRYLRRFSGIPFDLELAEGDWVVMVPDDESDPERQRRALARQLSVTGTKVQLIFQDTDLGVPQSALGTVIGKHPVKTNAVLVKFADASIRNPLAGYYRIGLTSDHHDYPNGSELRLAELESLPTALPPAKPDQRYPNGVRPDWLPPAPN